MSDDQDHEVVPGRSAAPTVCSMDEAPPTTLAASGIGTTALGRLHLMVSAEGEASQATEKVVTRRWPDAAAARAWCDRFVSRLPPDSSVLEIQVFEESWTHARSWESRPNRPEFNSLQVGVLLEGANGIRWGHALRMTPLPGARRLS